MELLQKLFTNNALIAKGLESLLLLRGLHLKSRRACDGRTADSLLALDEEVVVRWYQSFLAF